MRAATPIFAVAIFLHRCSAEPRPSRLRSGGSYSIDSRRKLALQAATTDTPLPTLAPTEGPTRAPAVALQIPFDISEAPSRAPKTSEPVADGFGQPPPWKGCPSGLYTAAGCVPPADTYLVESGFGCPTNCAYQQNGCLIAYCSSTGKSRCQGPC